MIEREHERFEPVEGRQLLERTPSVLRALLHRLPDAWLRATEGPGTWSPRDVVAHLAELEGHAWIGRAEHLLRHGAGVPFPTIDRTRFDQEFAGRDLPFLLELFADRRAHNLAALDALELSPDGLARCGRHAAFGEVTLGQLLATWVVHDLTHIAQIVRVLARRYDTAVGPWKQYLSVLRPTGSGGA